MRQIIDLPCTNTQLLQEDENPASLSEGGGAAGTGGSPRTGGSIYESKVAAAAL